MGNIQNLMYCGTASINISGVGNHWFGENRIASVVGYRNYFTVVAKVKYELVG